MEPNRYYVPSTIPALLKIGIVRHLPSAAGGGRQVTAGHNQMATAQTLLLLWRKPAVRYSCCVGTHRVQRSKPGQEIEGESRFVRDGV